MSYMILMLMLDFIFFYRGPPSGRHRCGHSATRSSQSRRHGGGQGMSLNKQHWDPVVPFD